MSLKIKMMVSVVTTFTLIFFLSQKLNETLRQLNRNPRFMLMETGTVTITYE